MVGDFKDVKVTDRLVGHSVSRLVFLLVFYSRVQNGFNQDLAAIMIEIR